MPVKVRCESCSTTLNVPDKAAGKTIACPKCQGKIKVPGGATAGGAGKSKTAPARKQVNPEDALQKLRFDELEMEHEEEQICPYCAAEMQYDDEGELEPVCAKCGMNIETGQMDAKEKKRRSRKGPPTEEYWGKVWSESLNFLKQYPGLGLRTGTYVGLFLVITTLASYMVSFCVGGPTKTFWGVFSFITMLGIPGWYSVLCRKIVSTTLLKEELQTDRIFFDMFESMSSGMRMLMWPLIVMLPLLPILLPILLFLSTVAAVLGGPIGFLGGFMGFSYAICIWMLPIAVCHFTAKYTYKGWILWELLKLMGKNGAGAAYWVLASLVMMLPVAVIAVPTFVLLGDANLFYAPVLVGEQKFSRLVPKEEQQQAVAAEENPAAAKKPARIEYERFDPDPPATKDIAGVGVNGVIALWLMNLLELGQEPSGFWYYIVKGALNVSMAFLIYMPLCIMLGFSLVFAMKANAVFAYYFQPSLGLVQRMQPLTPATFWVRFLSYQVDNLLIPFSCFLVTANPQAMMAAWALNGIGLVVFLFNPGLIGIYINLLVLYYNWMYWVVQEASPIKSTLGQDGFGLIVLPEDSEAPITYKQANTRFVLRLLSQLLFGLPFLMALTNPERRALHDKLSKTRVVWKGDR
jgi:uncharacterized RDD family membrane protein YckC